MGKLNRGNLLATIKKLKKMPRPKVVIANPAVQAICGVKDAPKPNKTDDLKSIVERRRTLLNKPKTDYMSSPEYIQFESDFYKFVEDYKKRKSSN